MLRKPQISIFILLLIFLVAALIRLPTLNRPLSKHHEFCTAVALRVMQIWDKSGIASYHFNPVMTYPEKTDKFINNHASGSGKMKDTEGNYFYVSHPPFGYYLPYMIFQIFRIKPDVLALQLFNLFVHFLGGIGVFIIISLTPTPVFQNTQIKGNGIYSNKNIGALAGYIAYLFSPGPLWFHSNVYMADILVQLFFIYGAYFALQFFMEGKMKWMTCLAAASFLMTYTSWLGVFFCLTVFGMSILRQKWRLAAIIMFACASAILLTAFQYAQVAGWESLKTEWLARFSERAGWQPGEMIGGAIVILQNYLTGYLPLIVAIFILLIAAFKNLKHYIIRVFKNFIFLSVIPVILLHVVLSNYSGHDFTTLYGGLFLSILFGTLVYFAAQKLNQRMLASGIILMAGLSIAQYFFIPS